MKIEFLSKFLKDLDKIKSKKTKSAIKEVIIEVKSANSIQEINNLKKLTGHKFAYRIRSGQYRVGIFIENEIVQFARVSHRKDIYRLFP
jgi:mRNA interferase RelE/StbE